MTSIILQHLHLTEFVPHKVCWLMRYEIIYTHAVGDGLTALAYYTIPILLFYASRKYRFGWKLSLILYVYATFIFLCGTTHLLDVIMIWYISETLLILDGWLRVITGVFSVFSAGVTIWALQIFVTLLSQLIAVFNRIVNERKELGRATDEAIKKYDSIMEEARSYIQPKKTV